MTKQIKGTPTPKKWGKNVYAFFGQNFKLSDLYFVTSTSGSTYAYIYSISNVTTTHIWEGNKIHLPHLFLNKRTAK